MTKKIPEEIMTKVVRLDCRKEGNIRRLEKSLKKLPFIKDESDLETDRLEEIVKKIEIKHKINLAYLMKFYLEDNNYFYSGMIKTKDKKAEWLITVNGITIRETLMKTLFFMYYHIQNKKE